MVKYGETFYRRHTALIPAAVYKINVKKIAFKISSFYLIAITRNARSVSKTDLKVTV